MTKNRPIVIGGVDTHGYPHHAAVIDTRGRILGSEEFEATSDGYRKLLAWIRRFGDLDRLGVEGTGTYGAGLCRHLLDQGVQVVEVDRPNRRMRRQHGKSDSINAEAAARSVLNGTATAEPKHRDGVVESIRVLRVAKSGAVKARTAATNALKAMLVTAPDELRSTMAQMSTAEIVDTCSKFRPSADRLSEPTQGVKLGMRSLARRVIQLTEEIKELDAAMRPLVRHAAPRTTQLLAIGTDHAAQLLITAGDNPARMRSEASFARLCGVAPIPASSGQTQRHRLHRGGDRSANRALHLAVIVRLRHCEETRAYVERRTKEGLSKREIIRCLKRYVAREVFHTISADLRSLHGLDGI